MAESASTRPRRTAVVALIAVAFVSGILAAFALWSKRQLLETESWTSTSTELLADEDVRVAVGAYLVDTLFSEVDVQAELAQGLPPRLAPAAAPIAGAIRQFADQAVDRALQRPEIQELWKHANERAHATLLNAIESGGSEDVRLDLGEIADRVGERVGISDASSKLPPRAAEIVILDNEQLAEGRDAVDLLETLAWALVVAALLLFALAVYLAAGWRREALRLVGVALIATGVVILVARQAAGNYVVDQLASTAAVEPSVDSTWTIGTSMLAEIGSAVLFYGVAIVLGAWLAGPSGAGRTVRRELAPVLARRGTAHAALAIVLGLLFWWSPTPGFERLPVAILLIGLFVVGLESLRRQAIRDFPNEDWETGIRRWKAAASSAFGRRRAGGGK